MGWQAGLLLALLLASPWLAVWREDPAHVCLAGCASALALVSVSARAPRGLSRAAWVVLLAGGAAVWLLRAVFPPLTPARDDAALLLAGIACFSVAATSVRAADRERVLIGVGVGGAILAAVLLLCVAPGSRTLCWLDLTRVTRWLSIPCALGLAGLLACASDGRKSRWSVLWFCVLSACGAAIATWGTPDTWIALGIATLVLVLLCLRTRHFSGAPVRRTRSIAVWGALTTLLCVAGRMLTSTAFDEPGLLLGAAALAGLACPAPSRRIAPSVAVWSSARSGLALVALLLLSVIGARGPSAVEPAEPRMTAGAGAPHERHPASPGGTHES
jgi:hypothetical protein